MDIVPCLGLCFHAKLTFLRAMILFSIVLLLLQFLLFQQELFLLEVDFFRNLRNLQFNLLFRFGFREPYLLIFELINHPLQLRWVVIIDHFGYFFERCRLIRLTVHHTITQLVPRVGFAIGG